MKEKIVERIVYMPTKPIGPSFLRKLFIDGIRVGSNRHELFRMPEFKNLKIAELRLHYAGKARRARGNNDMFAFVEFESQVDCTTCLGRMDTAYFKGLKLRVRRYSPSDREIMLAEIAGATEILNRIK